MTQNFAILVREWTGVTARTKFAVLCSFVCLTMHASLQSDANENYYTKGGERNKYPQSTGRYKSGRADPARDRKIHHAHQERQVCQRLSG